MCVSLDWLLKQPRSHFVQKESRTCQGCWQSVLGISGPAARQSLIPHCIVIYLLCILRGFPTKKYTRSDAGNGQKISEDAFLLLFVCLFVLFALKEEKKKKRERNHCMFFGESIPCERDGWKELHFWLILILLLCKHPNVIFPFWWYSHTAEEISGICRCLQCVSWHVYNLQTKAALSPDCLTWQLE